MYFPFFFFYINVNVLIIIVVLDIGYHWYTVVLDLKAHPPAGHTRAAGAVFQGTGQGTPQDPPRRQPRPGSSGLGTILGTGSGLGQDWVRTGHTRARTGHTCRFSVPARARPDVPGTVRAA